MPRLAKSVLLVLTVLLISLVGCSKQDETHTQVSQVAPGNKLTRVVVPDDVKGRWKAVKIAVQDKENSQQDVYTVNIGNGFVVGGSALHLKVEAFLPYFQMDGMKLTSASNDPRNPAARISISEDGLEVFNGWLFSKYPNTHAFQHPRYSFSLVDFIPSS